MRQYSARIPFTWHPASGELDLYCQFDLLIGYSKDASGEIHDAHVEDAACIELTLRRDTEIVVNLRNSCGDHWSLRGVAKDFKANVWNGDNGLEEEIQEAFRDAVQRGIVAQQQPTIEDSIHA